MQIWILNSCERIDCIRSLCTVSINGCSLLMADMVLKPVELIPVFRDSFPRRLCRGVSEFKTLKKSLTESDSPPTESGLRRGVSIQKFSTLGMLAIPSNDLYTLSEAGRAVFINTVRKSLLFG